MPSLAAVIRALETLSFGLCLLGWLLLGIFGTWKDAAPFWIGAPFLWLAALAGIFTLHRGLRGRLSVPCLVSVVLFTAYITWRGLTSDVAYLARQDLVFAATAFIGWVLAAARFERPRHRFALIIVWALLILGNLGMGLWQMYGNDGANPLSWLGFTRSSVDAVFGGFYPNSNHLCAFMELTSFILLGIAVFGRVHSFVRVLCGLVFVVAFITAALSTSRAGLLAMGLGTAVFGGAALVLSLMRRRQQGGRSFTGVLFGLMIAGCLAIGVFAWGRLEAKFGEGRVLNNLNGRAEMWDRANVQWQEAPLFGAGARSFEYYERSLRTMETKWVTWSDTDVDAVFAHNDWLQLLADYGVAGLLLALAVLGLHCWKAFGFVIHEAQDNAGRGATFRDSRGAVTLGALCGMLGFAVHCVADFNMHIGVIAVLAATVLGFMANPGPAEEETEWVAAEPEVPAQRPWRMTATLAACVPAAVMSWHVLPWAAGDYHYHTGLSVFLTGADSLEDSFTAASDMKKAVDADPKNYDAWIHYGLACKLTVEFLSNDDKVTATFVKKALESFEAAYRLYPQNAYTSMYIGRTLDGMRRFEEAEKWWRRALAWASGSRLINHYYGDHLMAMGRYHEASLHYIAALHRQGGWKRKMLEKKVTRATEMARKKLEAEKAPAPAPQ